MAAHEEDSEKRHYLTYGITIVVVVLAIGFSLYFYHAYKKALADNPTAQQQDLVTQVNNLAVTPSEQPQIATVKDASKLVNSILANETQDGDVLFVYNKSNRIIIFRPTIHKVVDMLTVQPNQSVSTGTSSTKH